MHQTNMYVGMFWHHLMLHNRIVRAASVPRINDSLISLNGTGFKQI